MSYSTLIVLLVAVFLLAVSAVGITIFAKISWRMMKPVSPDIEGKG